jgi:spore maturation protein CgeB
MVDVVNLGYNSGISPKIMGCFACGGLMLFDYKADFEVAMGEEGLKVMYRDVEELNTLIDRYLGDPALRRDVCRYLQHQAVTKFSFGALCRRILLDEAAWRT